MSRDLTVISHEQPPLDGLDQWLEQQGGWRASVTGGLALVERAGPRSTSFAVEGPLRVEAEDLPPELAMAVVVPRWSVQLMVPGDAPEPASRLAVQLAQWLAEASRGIVFDPQADRITWPRGKRRRLAPMSGMRTTKVELSWAIPAQAFEAELPRRFLAVLRRLLPEGSPRRFGSFEPLQGRIEDGDDAFVEAWVEEQVDGVGLFFWKGTSPVMDGHVAFPERIVADGIPAGAIELHIDGRAFDDPRWRELAGMLLDGIGDVVGAFYGRATYEPHRAGGMFAFELAGAAPPPVSAGAWIGLPDHPAWLTWLSGPYASRVDGATIASDRLAHGLLVRLSDEPREAMALSPWHDRFPPELCRSSDPPPADRSHHLERQDRPARPAPVIPLTR